MINEEIKKLINLQEMDLVIDHCRNELKCLPEEIDSIKNSIQQLKIDLELEKKHLQSIQVRKKEKEVECAAQEDKIRKNEMELNTIKSNESYKTMLKEIENGRNNKAQIEDEILNLMLETDAFIKEQKNRESDSKSKEQSMNMEIQKKEELIKNAQKQLESEIAKRQAFTEQISKPVLNRYNFIREKKKGITLSQLKGDSCGGCNTLLTQSTINEIKKGKDMIVCESCSVILYIPEPPVPSASTLAS